MHKGLRVRCLLLSFFILFFELNALYARSSDRNGPFSQLQPVFTFTAGPSMSQLGQSQTFTPVDLCHYNYKPNRSATTNMLWGGFVGSEVKPSSSSWGIIAGLGYYQPNSLSSMGALTQGVDPMSESTYRYKYQIQSQQLLAEGKLYWIAKERVRPFLMVGIGAAFNKMSDYQTNIPPFFEFTPVFTNHSQTNFTYAIGSGIDMPLSNSLRIGVIYRFTDLGAANTGSAQIDEIPIASTLKQSHLYANQILIQLTFIPWTRN